MWISYCKMLSSQQEVLANCRYFFQPCSACLFKYANFLLSTIGSLRGSAFETLSIALPIGISFFTFTQIAFLADTYQGKVREYRFIHYVLFVTYFPHLVAGPVLHHKEMMPQFGDSRTYTFSTSNFSVGLTIFVLGLAKKLLIADSLAPYADALFSTPHRPSFFIAWGGVLAYAFQLYFDFSGYSDMAIGLSRLFGIRLPLNFNSPYKSVSIAEFWRRWHMTLSRFLRDYLYITLGGNRHGRARRYLNLMITMLLGGLWHGAGWGYVAWGGLHGLYLVINHAWSKFSTTINFPTESTAWKFSATLLTFFSVCIAWVFFRSPTVDSAVQIVTGMAGGFGVGIPEAIAIRLGGFRSQLEYYGVVFFIGGGSHFLETWIWTFFAAFIAFTFPNTQQITSQYEPALDSDCHHDRDRRGLHFLVWHPTRKWALLIGLLAVVSLISINRPSEFLYFQF